MQAIHEGFIKMFASESNGEVIGGVVVGPRASELIHTLTLAVANRLTVDQVAAAMTTIGVWPWVATGAAAGLAM